MSRPPSQARACTSSMSGARGFGGAGMAAREREASGAALEAIRSRAWLSRTRELILTQVGDSKAINPAAVCVLYARKECRALRLGCASASGR